MVGARKTKKKRPNKKLFIAIGLAALLGLLLITLMSGQGSKFNQVSDSLKALQEEKSKLQKELEDLKDNQRLQLRTQQLAQPTVEQKKNTLSVVVAKHPIDAGTRLGMADLEIKEWPQEAVPLNAANFVESLIGRITSADIASGEPVLPAKLISKDTKTLSIPDGYRAMTLPITGITGVGGFITPGARVDILTVVPKSIEGSSDSNEQLSKILMQNVKVLASDGDPNDTGGGRGKKSGGSSEATITIAVPAEQAVKLALAFNNGRGNIQVVLRGFQDGSEIAKTSIDTAELVTGQIDLGEEEEVVIPDVALPPPPTDSNYSAGANMDLNSILTDVDGLPPPQPPTAKTKTHSIEIIEANSRQEVSFETEI